MGLSIDLCVVQSCGVSSSSGGVMDRCGTELAFCDDGERERVLLRKNVSSGVGPGVRGNILQHERRTKKKKP